MGENGGQIRQPPPGQGTDHPKTDFIRGALIKKQQQRRQRAQKPRESRPRQYQTHRVVAYPPHPGNAQHTDAPR